MTTVAVPERGFTTIPPETLDVLGQTREFWSLVDAGIVTVALRPGGDATLTAGPYVGRTLCGDVLVEVVEKVPGALRALLDYASSRAFRLEALPGTRTDLGPLMALLVAAFVSEVRAYLTIGKEFAYARRRDRGPVLAGSIDVPGTALARARGMSNQIVFHRAVVTHETDTNVVVQRALREIEQIARVIEIEPADVVQARALGMYFDDFPKAQPLRRLDLAQRAERLTGKDTRHAMLSLAALLLRHESFEHKDWTGDPTPRTWFINLERLFEDALLKEINRLGFADIAAKHGATQDRSIYAPPQFERADPDIVLLQDGAVVGVGDAKYKTWVGSPSRADVYQLLVHAAAFASPVAFLVYAHDAFASQFLGHSVTGAAVHAFALDVTDLPGSVLSMLGELDAPSS